jgi:DNA polymerase-3 subunit gamma/tau
MKNKEAVYQVLARKYRPVDFNGLIGQEALVRTMTNAIDNDRIPHAFLLTGIRGIGKTTTARIIAKSLNCTGKDGTLEKPAKDPCGVCHNCIAITEDRHADVLEMDAASKTGIDDVREIIENTNYTPTIARYKIYIIDEVHMLSNNAFNALLKTLEEPPAHTKFIFATTEIRKIPLTILSRCQRFNLRRVNIEELSTFLSEICKKENSKFEEAAINIIASAAEGSVRDALSLLDQAISFSNHDVTEAQVKEMLGLANKGQIVELFAKLVEGKITEVLNLYAELVYNGAEPLRILKDLIEIDHFICKTKIIGNNDFAPLANEEYKKSCADLAEKLSIGNLSRLWQAFIKAMAEMPFVPDQQSAVEMVLIRSAHMASGPSVKQIIDDLAESSNDEPAKEVANSAAPAVVAQTVKLESPNNFQEFAELFNHKKEAWLYNLLVHETTLVNFANPKITLKLSSSCQGDFTQRIRVLLKEWLNEDWQIETSQAEGGKSLAAQQAVDKANMEKEIAESEAIQQVKQVFAKSEVLSIKQIVNH